MDDLNDGVIEWRKKGKHLPRFMRDFHDQKDLFKAIDEIIIHEPDPIRKELTWIDGHIYVIDTFLWFMARYGYTLQKSRKRLEFRNIGDDIEYCRKERAGSFNKFLKEEMNKKLPIEIKDTNETMLDLP